MRSPRALIAVAALAITATMAAACSRAPAPPAKAPSAKAPSTSATPSATQTHYPLTITEPDGTTAVITAPPTRIITVGNPHISMDNVVALGVKPIGGEVYTKADQTSDARGIPNEIANQITTFTSVGSASGSADLEAIAALHPDLIVSPYGKSTSDLKQLEAIAPVESTDVDTPPAGNGIDSLESIVQVKMLGRILNRQAQANAFIAKFKAAAASVRAAVAGKTVDLVSPSATGSSFSWFGADAQPTGHFLAALGLVLPTAFPGDGKRIITGDYNYSMERVSYLTAQYLVLGVQPSAYASFVANPLVKQLPAVKAGRVIQTKGASEGFGDGYLVAGAVGQFDALAGIQKAFTTTGSPP